MMNRRTFAATAFGSPAWRALSLAAPASAQTKWNLPAGYPADNLHTENILQFAKDVEAGTGGKLVDHRPRQRLALQGSRDQARGRRPARRRSAKC